MDLSYNVKPRLTDWIVANELLNSPFVLIDVGVRGGVHSRWWHLGDQLEIHGIDAAEEAIAPLAAAARPGERYYITALGDREGEVDLFVPKIAAAASLHPREFLPDQARMAIDPANMADAHARVVPITRLDTLMASQGVEKADFLKLDCEGAEPEILAGARGLLATAGLLGIESETSFDPIDNRQSHFAAIFGMLMPHGFRLADAAFGRFAYSSFAERARVLGRKRAIGTPVSRPASANALFFRDLTAAGKATPDELLKSAIILELYGMNDVAHDLLTFFRDDAPPDFPIAEAADKLVYPVVCSCGSLRAALRQGIREVAAAMRHSLRFRRGRSIR